MFKGVLIGCLQPHKRTSKRRGAKKTCPVKPCPVCCVVCGMRCVLLLVADAPYYLFFSPPSSPSFSLSSSPPLRPLLHRPPLLPLPSFLPPFLSFFISVFVVLPSFLSFFLRYPVGRPRHTKTTGGSPCLIGSGTKDWRAAICFPSRLQGERKKESNNLLTPLPFRVC